jgi:hypothetical protein
VITTYQPIGCSEANNPSAPHRKQQSRQPWSQTGGFARVPDNAFFRSGIVWIVELAGEI